MRLVALHPRCLGMLQIHTLNDAEARQQSQTLHRLYNVFLKSAMLAVLTGKCGRKACKLGSQTMHTLLLKLGELVGH